MQLQNDELISSEVKTPLCAVDADSSTCDDVVAVVVGTACGVENAGAVADRVDKVTSPVECSTAS